MPKRTRDHRAWMLEQLVDSRIAANYLNAAILDSPTLFLTTLRDVAKAHKMTKVARGAGVRREALYRTLSRSGNPRLNTLDAVLKFLGLRLSIEPQTPTAPTENLQPRTEMAVVGQRVASEGPSAFSEAPRVGPSVAQEVRGHLDAFPAIRSQEVALGGH